MSDLGLIGGSMPWFWVNAYENAGLVKVCVEFGALEISYRMYPDEARALAARLIEAAEQVEGAARG